MKCVEIQNETHPTLFCHALLLGVRRPALVEYMIASEEYRLAQYVYPNFAVRDWSGDSSFTPVSCHPPALTASPPDP